MTGLSAALVGFSLNAVAQEIPADFDLDAANNNFAEFFDDGLYDQAAVAATQALWTARINFGEESIEAALAQVNLANAQQKTGDHAAAIDSYEKSIRRLEAVEGIVSPKLVNPLMGLAASQNAMGAYDRGLITYQRALRLNHVDNGLYNEAQLPIRDGLTETYLALGDKSDADFQQEIQVVIMQQEYGNNTDKVLPAMYKLANWYQRSNQPDKQAYQYQKAVQLIREETFKNNPDQIQALRELSKTYYRMNMPSESMRLLKQSYRLNAEAAEPDPLLAADINVQIGDFYNLFGSPKDASKHYKMAWNTLSGIEGQDSLLEEYFGRPVFLEGPVLPDVYPAKTSMARMYMENPQMFGEGYLMAEYDVDDRGRVENVRIIESDPPSLMDRRMRSSLARQRYRPKIVNGEMASAEGERLTHNFNYELGADKREQKQEKLMRPGQLMLNP